MTAGYENNPAANAAAFHEGWFRTGDQGYLDAAGYLRLTGRLKEIISRPAARRRTGWQPQRADRGAARM